jgi:hypothetical protein
MIGNAMRILCIYRSSDGYAAPKGPEDRKPTVQRSCVFFAAMLIPMMRILKAIIIPRVRTGRSRNALLTERIISISI